jgi:hypothetical protein
MRSILKRIFFLAAILLAVLYMYDYLSVLHRKSAHKQGDPFDAVVHPRLLAIPQKGNRVEFALDAQSPMVSDACVHSIFPHFGYTPCWYISRNALKPIPMVIVMSTFWLRPD